MSNQTYDKLKFFTMIVLPALGTFYFTLSQLWNFPAADQVVGTIAAISVLLGAILHTSTKQYKKGVEVDADYTESSESI